MENLSMATGIGGQIGALELAGDWERHNDSALEHAAASALMGPPTGPRWTGACCGRMDDGVLEAAGVTANGGPTTTGYCPPTRMCR